MEGLGLATKFPEQDRLSRRHPRGYHLGQRRDRSQLCDRSKRRYAELLPNPERAQVAWTRAFGRRGRPAQIEFRSLARRSKEAASAPESAPQFYFIDVSLQAITDEDERNGFQSIPTALTLDPATVDRLRAVAHKLLLESADFKKLVEDLGS